MQAGKLNFPRQDAGYRTANHKRNSNIRQEVGKSDVKKIKKKIKEVAIAFTKRV